MLSTWVSVFEMAELRVGLGPVFLAPKRRFMVAVELRWLCCWLFYC